MSGRQRLPVQSDKEDATPVLRRNGRDAIKGIKPGERMPEQNRTCILVVIQARFSDTPVKAAC